MNQFDEARAVFLGGQQAAPAPTSGASSGTSSSSCPKCSWHNPPQLASCAKCGVVFAKMKTAKTKPQQTEQQQEAFDPFAPSPILPQPVRLPFDVSRAVNVVGDAVSSTFGQGFTIGLLAIVPSLVAVPLAFGAALVFGVAAGAKAGVAGVAAGAIGILAVMAVVLVVYARCMAGTVLVIDDARTGLSARSFSEAFSDGGQHAWRVITTMFLQGLVGVGLVAPVMVLAARTAKDAGPYVLLASVAVVVPLMLFVMMRLSLMVPVAVLERESAFGALATSWKLTGGRLAPLAVGGLLMGLVVMAVGGVGAVLSLIPLLGFFIAVVANVLAQGLIVAHSVHVWAACREAA